MSSVKEDVSVVDEGSSVGAEIHSPPTEQPTTKAMSRLEKAKAEAKAILRKTSDPSRLMGLDAALHLAAKDSKNMRVTTGKGVSAAFEGLKVGDIPTLEDADALRALYIAKQGDWQKKHLQNENTAVTIVSGGKNAVAPPEANEQAALEFLQERGYSA